jgi:hypothetical protein
MPLFRRLRNYDASFDNIIQKVMIKIVTYGRAEWAYIGGKESTTYSKILCRQWSKITERIYTQCFSMQSVFFPKTNIGIYILEY